MTRLAQWTATLPSLCSSSKSLPWIILLLAATNVIFLGGKRRAFGMFVAELKMEFNQTSLAELNWIGNSYAAFGYISTPLSTALILAHHRQYALFQFLGAIFVLSACISSAYVPNPHWLFITHTFLHGIGSSLILSTVGLVVDEHFPKDHSYHILATTLISGGSVAAIIFVLFFAYLIETYHWRVALLILGVIYFLIHLSGSLVFQTRYADPDKKVESQSPKPRSWKDLLTCKNIPLLVSWTIDRMITSIVTYGMLLNLGYYQRRHEASLVSASVLTTLFAAGEATSYIIGGTITAITKTFFHNRLKYILLVTTTILSILLLLWEKFQNYYEFSKFVAFFSGLCLGPSITFLFPAGEEMTTLPGSMAYPFSLSGMGLGMLISPLLTAMIAEATNYKHFFMIQGFLLFIKMAALGFSTFYIWYFSLNSEKNIADPSTISSISPNHHYGSIDSTNSIKTTDFMEDFQETDPQKE